jgi:hypothetical protein
MTPWIAIALLGGQNLVVNGRFDQGSTGWSELWLREPNSGTAKIQTTDDKPELAIGHAGARDWSFEQTKTLPTRPGDIFRIATVARCDAAGDAGISVVVRNSAGDVLNWALAATHTTGHHGWQRLERRFVVPSGAATLQFRFEGNGPGSFEFRDAELTPLGNADSMQKGVGPSLHLKGRFLDLTVTGVGSITLKTLPGGPTFSAAVPDAILKGLKQTPNGIRATYWDVANDVDRVATYALDPSGKEVVATIEGDGKIEEPFAVPGAIETKPGDWLIVPMNEGILYPVDDPSIEPRELVTYGGHGICMPWYGVMNPRTGAGLLSIVETNDDAAIRIEKSPESRLQIQPVWQASRGRLRYGRRIRLVPISAGGYVAMARRYREFAQTKGLAVTLSEKRKRTPAVDRLIGAINVWWFGSQKLALCREMKSMGMDRVLWSAGGTADEIREINQLGFLSSRYDIYQDVWDPKIALPWMNTAGWPDDLVDLPDGSWMKGWAHPDRQADGSIHWLQGGVISSPRGLARAKKVIPEELARIPFRCRFIDTTTASPWREDYNPAHPLTRSDDRKYKMALLEFCSKDEGLVVGSETGIDASVPYLEYFEGMMSLGPYRLPDSGTDMMAYRKPTEDFLKFQVGYFYRLPLWELVYHDCTVAQWYWGDASNKEPEVWNRRDLFNILYGTAPLVMFDDARWAAQKDRILKTYHDVCAWTRKIGYERMISHEFLSDDHTVQRTRWTSGHWCVVNFGSQPAAVGGNTIQPMGFLLR